MPADQFSLGEPGPVGRVVRLLHTAKYLKRRQITDRIRRKLCRRRANFAPAPELRSGQVRESGWIPSTESMLPGNRFDFLNIERSLSFPGGWNSPELAKLWLYNLHYFDGLACPRVEKTLKQDLVAQWIRGNFSGAGVGWEPYPTSLRIVNWIKWQLQEDSLPAAAFDSLAAQTRYLEQDIEYHLMGNHLLANAKALIFAGLFFAGNEGDGWLERGMAILEAELEEQFLADGGHFELSPAYHALASEDLLDLANLYTAYGRPVPDFIGECAKSALSWLGVLTRPDGRFPLFNDSAYGISPQFQDLVEYAARTGLAWHQSSLLNGCTPLRESGYFRYQSDRYLLLGDLGNIAAGYIPGHTHNDAFSFDLSVDGAPVIVDTGVSTYDQGMRRMEERGVLAHNTVSVEGAEQNEIWQSFRVARRSRVENVQYADHAVSGLLIHFDSHIADHGREFRFAPTSIELVDSLGGPASGEARLHFAPGIVVVRSDDGIVAGPLEITFTGDPDIQIIGYLHAPEFNNIVECKALSVKFTGQLTTVIRLKKAG